MTVVVTGASGHVGANLIRALLAQGRPTRALLHRDRRAIDGLKVETVEGDICDLHSLCQAFDGADTVYHLAANISLLMSAWPRLHAVNVIGTQNVVEACLRCGVRRLVHFSSIHALVPKPSDAPVDELRPLVESSNCPPYDRSKAASEKEVRKGIERGLDAVIISPTAIVGPHDYQLSHFGAVLLALANHKLPALVAGGFDWVDVRDVVEGAMQAEERAQCGAKYLLSGHWVSIQDVAVMVTEVTGAPVPGFVCPTWLARIGAPMVTAYNRILGRRPLYTSYSIKTLRTNQSISHQRATHEFGYHPRPFRETLFDTLRWFEQTGQLAYPPKLQPQETR